MPRGDRENLASTDEDQKYLPSPANIEFLTLLILLCFCMKLRKTMKKCIVILFFGWKLHKHDGLIMVSLRKQLLNNHILYEEFFFK